VSFTQKNLREVKDSAIEFGVSENQEARFPQGDLKAENTGLAYFVFRPGKRSAFGHRHQEAEEIYVVLSGSGRLRLDDEIVELEPMDAVRVAAKVTRAFEADDEGLEILAFGRRHEGDGEIVPDFWT